ncbi:hypothetical protein TUBRATIS_006550 [Tubulinosema ratisbonensis]|uniref:Uncharacterized protein n=1 Tax=Tubulinosema ratisbonensis TaxID=291195 RepID=A0A437ANR9_9MICR|nr:hypothetical protein TUBRATIS_006550 [Tubulinosema ratisbonensis]
MKKRNINIKDQSQNATFTLQSFLQDNTKDFILNEYSLMFIFLESLYLLHLIIRLDYTSFSQNAYALFSRLQLAILILLLIFRVLCAKYKYKIYKIITIWIIILFIYSFFKFIIFLIITIIFDSYQLLTHVINNQSILTIELLFLFFLYLILFLGTSKIFFSELKTLKNKVLILEFSVIFLSFVLILLYLFSLFNFRDSPYMEILIFVFIFHTLTTILMPFLFIKRVKEKENMKIFFYMYFIVKMFLTKIILFKFLTDYFIFEHRLNKPLFKLLCS